MKINIVGIGMTVGDQLKAKVEKKLEKYHRFFGDNTNCQIKFTVVQKEQVKAEITIKVGSTHYRAESVEKEEAILALDNAIDRLERRIRKQKSRLKKRKHEYGLDSFLAADEFSGQIEVEDIAPESVVFEKRKSYTLAPMLPEDAVIGMELVGHSFFVFKNLETKEINVVYKRREGNYGILEPEKDPFVDANSGV